MREFCTGMFARSLAGHDKGNLYIIVSREEQFAWVADGRLRTLEKPKKKKWKHIQVSYEIPAPVAALLEQGRPLTNEAVKRAIKEKSAAVYNEEVDNVKGRCD